MRPCNTQPLGTVQGTVQQSENRCGTYRIHTIATLCMDMHHASSHVRCCAVLCTTLALCCAVHQPQRGSRSKTTSRSSNIGTKCCCSLASGNSLGKPLARPMRTPFRNPTWLARQNCWCSKQVLLVSSPPPVACQLPGPPPVARHSLPAADCFSSVKQNSVTDSRQTITICDCLVSQDTTQILSKSHCANTARP